MQTSADSARSGATVTFRVRGTRGSDGLKGCERAFLPCAPPLPPPCRFTGGQGPRRFGPRASATWRQRRADEPRTQRAGDTPGGLTRRWLVAAAVGSSRVAQRRAPPHHRRPWRDGGGGPRGRRVVERLVGGWLPLSVARGGQTSLRVAHRVAVVHVLHPRGCGGGGGRRGVRFSRTGRDLPHPRLPGRDRLGGLGRADQSPGLSPTRPQECWRGAPLVCCPPPSRCALVHLSRRPAKQGAQAHGPCWTLAQSAPGVCNRAYLATGPSDDSLAVSMLHGRLPTLRDGPAVRPSASRHGSTTLAARQPPLVVTKGLR